MWVCKFVSGVWLTKATCYCASSTVNVSNATYVAGISSHNLQTFTHWKETAWQLVLLLNLYICHNQKFIHNDVDETMTMWTDSETMKCFSNTCWLWLLLTMKIADKLLINERDHECHKAVVSDSKVTCMMRLVRWDLWEKFMMSCMRWLRWVRLIMIRFVRSERLMSDNELDEDCEGAVKLMSDDWWLMSRLRLVRWRVNTPHRVILMNGDTW